MSVTLDDALVLHLIRAMTRMPPVSGQLILSMLETQAATQAEQGKLLQQLMDKVNSMSQGATEFQTEVAGLRDDMAKQTTATNTMLVFITGIKQKLAEALALDPAAALAAVRQVHADLNTNTAAIVSAASENTTSAGEPTAPIEATTTVDTTGIDTSAGTIQGA